MIDETKALPCPFCGGAAEETSRFDVKCTGCGAEINAPPGQALELWNNRADLSPAMEGGEDVQGLKGRIERAIHRVTHGEGQMRVPVDPTDPDVVLGDCFVMLESLSAQLDRYTRVSETGYSKGDELDRIVALQAHIDILERELAACREAQHSVDWEAMYNAAIVDLKRVEAELAAARKP